MVGTALTWLVVHRNNLIKAIYGLSVAFLLSWGTILNHQNKKLSESLEMALNNIEAYLGSLAGSLLANNVLKLNIEDLQNQNDKLIHEIDSVRKELKIKPKQLTTAATQTLVIDVNDGKELESGAIQVKDSIYKDSLKYNDLTAVYYTITNDSISIGLDIRNTLYLYVYSDKHYKHKKNFLKRLFTLDFKKITSYRYKIVNTNDIIKTDDVRIIEIKNK